MVEVNMSFGNSSDSPDCADIEIGGAQKVAVFLMSLDTDNARSVLEMMDDKEIKEISKAMSYLGKIQSDVKENIINEVIESLDEGDDIVGTASRAERFLSDVLGDDVASGIMKDIRGPSGNTVWEKISNIPIESLYDYIEKEHPQSIALFLSCISSDLAAKLLCMFPDENAADLLLMISKMSNVDDSVIEVLEDNIEHNLISSLNKDSDNKEGILFEIFNKFNKNAEAKFMKIIKAKDSDLADKIRENMFTFDDISKVRDSDMQVVMKEIDKALLPVALKGAEDSLKEKFLDSISERAAKIMREDMSALGPIRISDVDQAQAKIVDVVKGLLDNDTIMLQGRDDIIE